MLSPGVWLGQGEIEFSASPETLTFFTRWKVREKDGQGRIYARQEIEIKGLSERMQSEFVLFNITDQAFEIEIENEALGKVLGKGIILPASISWEFKDAPHALEGFEFYEKIDGQNYRMRADFATEDNFRTAIEGKIWKKGAV